MRQSISQGFSSRSPTDALLSVKAVVVNAVCRDAAESVHGAGQGLTRQTSEALPYIPSIDAPDRKRYNQACISGEATSEDAVGLLL